nr:TetR/AcrR family transcriptional regulator [Rhodococcus sp. (in: high G+C Gram-positive bacteria)]
MDSTRRATRSDALANVDALLAAATARFAAEGDRASLRGIATDAGVGIGTLYRHFPTREHLVESVYRASVEQLCARASELVTAGSATEALRRWSEDFLDFLDAKRGIADTLRAVPGVQDDTGRTRRALADAAGVILAAGEADGTVDPGIEPMDFVLALGGIALVAPGAEQVQQSRRLLDLLLHGVLAK